MWVVWEAIDKKRETEIDKLAKVRKKWSMDFQSVCCLSVLSELKQKKI